MIRKIGLLLGLYVMLVSSLFAGELRFARHFSDNMVMQRDKPVLVKGFADKGSAVIVKFSGQEKAAKADENGQWSIILDPMQASAKPETLSAAAGTTVTLKNIIVGDVILFARQTSIDISLGRDDAGKKPLPDTRMLLCSGRSA
jgi:sialate O-acetylesterase